MGKRQYLDLQNAEFGIQAGHLFLNHLTRRYKIQVWNSTEKLRNLV